MPIDPGVRCLSFKCFVQRHRQLRLAHRVFVFTVTFTCSCQIGNALVVIVVAQHKKMRNRTNFYVANLAVSDLIVALGCMWVHLGSGTTINWPFGAEVCSFQTFIQGETKTTQQIHKNKWSTEKYREISEQTPQLDGCFVAMKSVCFLQEAFLLRKCFACSVGGDGERSLHVHHRGRSLLRHRVSAQGAHVQHRSRRRHHHRLDGRRHRRAAQPLRVEAVHGEQTHTGEAVYGVIMGKDLRANLEMEDEGQYSYCWTLLTLLGTSDVHTQSTHKIRVKILGFVVCRIGEHTARFFSS